MYDGGRYQWELRQKSEPGKYPSQKISPEERTHFSSVKPTGKTTITLEKDAAYDLSDKLSYTHEGTYKAVWASSDESVVKVDAAGNVTSVGAGSAKVTVSYENDSRTVTFNINVKSVA